jgi:hypothetical protein
MWESPWDSWDILFVEVVVEVVCRGYALEI